MTSSPEMLDAGEMPWYKFGTRFTGSLASDQAVVAAGMNWKLSKKDIPAKGEHRVPPGRRVLVREDLWDKNSGGALGYVPEDYIPFQNSEAFRLFDPIVQAGEARYDSAGAWKQGECG